MEKRASSPHLAVIGPSQNISRYSFARFFSRHGSGLLLFMVLLAEAGVGAFVIRDVLASYGAVHDMYDGSVRGLRRVGELQYEVQETRRSTLYALTTNDGNLQIDYADQSREADRRVTQGIAEYTAQARTAEQNHLAHRLADDWKAYLKIRDDVLGLILENSPKEAVDLDLSSGVPLFDRVRQDLEEIKGFYDEQASQQLAAVDDASRRSVIKLVAALGFGLLFGSLAIWAIQKTKMRSTVQLARLQMDFVASVSHELRTPITAILSAGENVRDGLVKTREGLIEQGTIISDQANQLMELVDQVLLFAATAKGEVWHNLRTLQVSDIIDHALASTAGLLQQSAFTIEKCLEPGLPAVIGDLSVLSQCLQNLIVNAVKYSDKDRWIGLHARIDAAVGEVEINVQDRGPGIEYAEMAHIFDPFYRSPRVVTAQIHGTGLGLSIAKRGADACGGRLTVVSNIGAGCVFTLHLLVAAENLEMAPTTASGNESRS